MSNFLVLMSDEHNPHYSEPYGHHSIKTPAMQALAETGVVYRSAYCPSPLCLPSRSAFVSGRRVHELQTYSNCNALLDPTAPSFGAALSQARVHSAYIGKTDVYTPGDALGFTEMIRPGDRKPPGDTNHRRNPMAIRKDAALRADGYGPRTDAASGDIRCVEDALRWIHETAPAIDGRWVLVVNVTSPHFPHYAHPEYWEMYPDGGDLPRYGLDLESARHPYAEAIRRHFQTDQFTDEQVRGLRRGYLACISFVDRQLGRLVDALQETGLADSTNVAYTSDHGDMLGTFGMWWKCSLYEHAARIPLIVSGPDFGEGVTVKTPVDLHDLQASLFAATGVPQPDGRLGEPLQNIIGYDPDRVVFSEYHGHGAPGSAYMIRKGPWKYLHYTGAPCQLFNLERDPDELTNVADAQSDSAADMESRLRNLCDPEAENERAERFINRQLDALAEAAGKRA